MNLYDRLLDVRNRIEGKIYDLPKVGRRYRKLRYKHYFTSLMPGEVAIDCGANVGVITNMMAKLGVTVYAFEPNPYAFEVLKDTFKKNELVHPIQAGVSDHKGSFRLYLHTEHADNPVKWSTGSSFYPDKSNVNKQTAIECEVKDLGEFISKINKPIGLLKIDIEGDEIAVMNQIIDLGLHKRIRYILVELTPNIASIKEPTKKLRERIIREKIRNVDLNWS